MWVAMWHGGSSYSPPYADDAELFPSLRTAGNALWFRRENGDRIRAHFRYLFRDSEMVYVPTVGEDSEMWLYRVPVAMVRDDREGIREYLERDAYPDRIIRFGPRGGIRVERT